MAWTAAPNRIDGDSARCTPAARCVVRNRRNIEPRPASPASPTMTKAPTPTSWITWPGMNWNSASCRPFMSPLCHSSSRRHQRRQHQEEDHMERSPAEHRTRQAGHIVAADRVAPALSHVFAGFSLTGAGLRALAAVVAHPQVLVGQQAVFHADLAVADKPAGEVGQLTRQRTDRRTVAAIEAGGDIECAVSANPVHQVCIYRMCHRNILVAFCESDASRSFAFLTMTATTAALVLLSPFRFYQSVQRVITIFARLADLAEFAHGGQGPENLPGIEAGRLGDLRHGRLGRLGQRGLNGLVGLDELLVVFRRLSGTGPNRCRMTARACFCWAVNVFAAIASDSCYTFLVSRPRTPRLV